MRKLRSDAAFVSSVRIQRTLDRGDKVDLCCAQLPSLTGFRIIKNTTRDAGPGQEADFRGLSSALPVGSWDTLA